MHIEERVTNLIESALENLGYELICVKQVDRETIQVMLDKEEGITIDDCTKATRLIGNILQIAEISDHYGLEVSSPGVERPLLKPEHFTRFIDCNIKLSTEASIDGQKKFLGKLLGFNQDTKQITLACENKVVIIDFNQVKSANLYYEHSQKSEKKIRKD